MVIRIGCALPLPGFFDDPLSADEGIRLAVIAHLDIGVALQVAQIAPRQGGDLALEQPVFHLRAGGRHTRFVPSYATERGVRFADSGHPVQVQANRGALLKLRLSTLSGEFKVIRK